MLQHGGDLPEGVEVQPRPVEVVAEELVRGVKAAKEDEVVAAVGEVATRRSRTRARPVNDVRRPISPQHVAWVIVTMYEMLFGGGQVAVPDVDGAVPQRWVLGSQRGFSDRARIPGRVPMGEARRVDGMNRYGDVCQGG